jgi:hypothetical protein
MKPYCRHQYLQPIFTACHRIVSPFALDKVYKHMQLFNLKDNTHLKPCTGQFKALMGLPCAHTVQECLQAKESLQSDHFNTHWLLE